MGCLFSICWIIKYSLYLIYLHVHHFQEGKERQREEGGQERDVLQLGQTRATPQLRPERHGSRNAARVCRNLQYGTRAQTQRALQSNTLTIQVAIEYYINEDPRKANHFQKKLTSLLTHPHTLDLI